MEFIPIQKYIDRTCQSCGCDFCRDKKECKKPKYRHSHSVQIIKQPVSTK